MAPDVVARLRVEADRRFIEKKNSRLMQQRSRNFEPALHAAGKRFHEVLFSVRKPDEINQHVDPLDSLRARDAVENSVQVHVS